MNKKLSLYTVGYTSILVACGLWMIVGEQALNRLMAELAALGGPFEIASALVPVITGCLFLTVLYEGIGRILIQRTIPAVIHFEQIRLEQVANLDHQTLAAYTLALENLGFTQVIDYQTQPNVVARLLTHPTHHCCAQICQGMAADTPQVDGEVAMFCVIQSFFEQNWTIGTHDRPITDLSAIEATLLALPRSVVMARPELLPGQLLQGHLYLRQQMIDDLNLRLYSDLSMYAVFEREAKLHQQRRRQLWRRSILWGQIQIWRFHWLPLSQQGQWLGAYERNLARRDRALTLGQIL